MKALPQFMVFFAFVTPFLIGWDYCLIGINQMITRFFVSSNLIVVTDVSITP